MAYLLVLSIVAKKNSGFNESRAEGINRDGIAVCKRLKAQDYISEGCCAVDALRYSGSRKALHGFISSF
jgi:hypothetical protein